jgi:hypothetical protein
VPLQVLRDQSSYSSWYFIERAYIGEINANVTIALTSSVLGGGGKGERGSAPQEHAAGLFSRFIGASGFQLINVNNVPLSLGSWALDTKLLGRKAMINSLARHYFAQGISEAHKVRPHPPPPPTFRRKRTPWKCAWASGMSAVDLSNFFTSELHWAVKLYDLIQRLFTTLDFSRLTEK